MSKSNIVMPKTVEAIKHNEDTRKNIPTAEYQSMVEEEAVEYKVAFERRNKDLDPQLVWRGKDIADWSDLVTQAPPLYIQEKVHPKALIDDLMQHSKEKDHASGRIMADLFSDFNGIPYGVDKTEFYQHDQHWSNRMILGDSLQVMASLAEREGLRAKVQCIYFDPPYGIKFNSNFQWSTQDKGGTDSDSPDKISRDPEQVKAFRDTWKDGIHSYLTYLRDRLTVARDLLKESGSIFVQISDENVHRIRLLLDEVFGDNNFISQISYTTTGGLASNTLSRAGDYIVWYAKSKQSLKYRDIVQPKLKPDEDAKSKYDQFEHANGVRGSLSKAKIDHGEEIDNVGKIFRVDNIISQGNSESTIRSFAYRGRTYDCGESSHWKTSTEMGMPRLDKANRIAISAKGKLGYIRFFDDFAIKRLSNLWSDIGGSVQSRSDPKIYVVQSGVAIIQRCILMTSDPGDLVLDPTCGSGTTATVAEQWGRRWITIDTSRVALALARARIMGSRYPFYLIADSKEGQIKEAEITRKVPAMLPTFNNIRNGFVYERVPHVTLRSIANNSEIDVIWAGWQEKLALMQQELNRLLNEHWQEWEIPRELDKKWPKDACSLHEKWWSARIARQRDIDASIAARAENEYLYDKPYEDRKKVRVAGPFTVESISPHRNLGLDENDELIDPAKQSSGEDYKSFAEMVLDNLKTAGVQQVHKEDKINFMSLTPWPGEMICAEGRYMEGETEKRAAIFVGPEFSTVQRADLVEAAREAADAAFDVLICCAFSYEAHTTEFAKLGRLSVLKARMNADLHMAGDLKNTGKGNLFVIFGEPDVEIIDAEGEKKQVKINGVDVFDPSTGEVRSDSADGIACWFIDTDYNNESFFVRHAYFLGANDPYGSLKTSLKAEINKEAWETLNSDISRPFPKPSTGRIAVKVINHLGDEVMKVFKIS